MPSTQMKRLFLLALLGLALLALVATPSHANASDDDLDESGSRARSEQTLVETTPWAADDFLNGEWEVYRHIISYSTSTVHLDHALPVIRWKLEKENTTQNLIGHAWVNGSDHEASAQALHIEFHDPSSGRFAVGSDEDTLRPLFSFAFQQVKGSVPMAAGKYLGAETQGDEGGAVYLFQASSPDRFTLTVTPRSFDLARAAKQPKVEAQQAKKAASEDEDDLMQSSGPASTGHPILTPEDLASFHGESFVYVGHRVKSEPEKSFFQKWGTMVMLAGMLVLNVYMRSRNVGGAGAAAAVASPRAAAARVAGGSSKKGGATVEEITEGEGAKKDK